MAKAYGPCPDSVSALGGDSAATIYWKDGDNVAPDNRPVGYTVHRYRLDGANWSMKGSTPVESSSAKQLIVEELQNDRIYRFTVSTKYRLGSSLESTPTAPVRPHKQVPGGWKLIDVEVDIREHSPPLYLNIRSGIYSYTYPETVLAVPPHLFLHFSGEEISALQNKFEERMDATAGLYIALNDVRYILLQLGDDSASEGVVMNLLNNQCTTMNTDMNISATSHLDISPTSSCKPAQYKGVTLSTIKEANISFQIFMAVVSEVKRLQETHQSPLQMLASIFKSVYTSLFKAAEKLSAEDLDMIKKIRQSEEDVTAVRIICGWEKRIHTTLHKPYYRNVQNEQLTWSMPDEVKFYLPGPLKAQLRPGGTTDPNSNDELSKLEATFKLLDFDGSGSISLHELQLGLKYLGQVSSESRILALLKEVDKDGSGEIDFDEFCVVMLLVRSGKASLGWEMISGDLSQAANGPSTEAGAALRAAGEEDIKGSISSTGDAPKKPRGPQHAKYCMCGCRRPTLEARLGADRLTALEEKLAGDRNGSQVEVPKELPKVSPPPLVKQYTRGAAKRPDRVAIGTLLVDDG